jgi:hypothetical protein
VELIEIIYAAEDPGFEGLVGEGVGGGERGRGGGGVEDTFDAGKDDLGGLREITGVLDDEAVEEGGFEGCGVFLDFEDPIDEGGGGVGIAGEQKG